MSPVLNSLIWVSHSNFLLLFNLQVASPLISQTGLWGGGGSHYFIGEISVGLVGGGTLPYNSYKPYQVQCKGESYQFSCQQDHLIQTLTDTHIFCYFIIRIQKQQCGYLGSVCLSIYLWFGFFNINVDKINFLILKCNFH